MNGEKLIVYLDIDGTLLYVPEGGAFPEELDGQLVCDGLEELLGFVVRHCQPYWLSYRAKRGKGEALQQRVLPHLPEIAKEIAIAWWNQNKLEALNTAAPFLWFDDFPEPEDEAWLREHNLMESLVRVESDRKDNPAIILATLKQRLALS